MTHESPVGEMPTGLFSCLYQCTLTVFEQYMLAVPCTARRMTCGGRGNKSNTRSNPYDYTNARQALS